MNKNKEQLVKKLHFPIMIEIDEDGYFIVSCPVFKGCHSYGETIDEAIENIKEVIEMCLEEQEMEPVNKFVGFRELEILQHA
ncbi:MAG: type II toxin-antitoxin system HicB family antitoxin [Candidatus Aminicenantes bacterium]|jgi:predicted RNase H-like HicB family nuclease